MKDDGCSLTKVLSAAGRLQGLVRATGAQHNRMLGNQRIVRRKRERAIQGKFSCSLKMLGGAFHYYPVIHEHGLLHRSSARK